QAEDGIRDLIVTGVQTCALPISSRLAAESLNIAPAKGLGDYRERFVTDRFIGTGPYRFVEHVVGDRVVVEANPAYWGPKPPSARSEERRVGKECRSGGARCLMER